MTSRVISMRRIGSLDSASRFTASECLRMKSRQTRFNSGACSSSGRRDDTLGQERQLEPGYPCRKYLAAMCRRNQRAHGRRVDGVYEGGLAEGFEPLDARVLRERHDLLGDGPGKLALLRDTGRWPRCTKHRSHSGGSPPITAPARFPCRGTRAARRTHCSTTGRRSRRARPARGPPGSRTQTWPGNALIARRG